MRCTLAWKIRSVYIKISLNKLPEILGIKDFLNLADSLPVLDVRTPAEFEKGHLPGAVNLPLFSNEERAVVGTLYKQEGQEPALMKGLELVGPRLKDYVLAAAAAAPERKVLLHCWRGGMRSGSFAQLLRACGFEACTLKGGYKSFRTHVLTQFEHPFTIWSIGGLTGSGKTEILQELRKLGEQVIDLEGLAGHLGSAFGTLGFMIQPPQEEFENTMALELAAMDPGRPVWLEDECINIGRIMIPQTFWAQMKSAMVFQVKLPDSLRKEHLLRQYGTMDREFLKERFVRIEKRLGSEISRRAIQAVEDNDSAQVLDITLAYYDKSYLKQLKKKDPAKLAELDTSSLDFGNTASMLKDFAYKTTNDQRH